MTALDLDALIDRHPHHRTIWTAALGLFGALWAGLVFTTKAPVSHGIGWASLAIAAYIFLSFFLPLPLPPIRDERKVAARRAEHERQLQLIIAALREEVAQNKEGPSGH